MTSSCSSALAHLVVMDLEGCLVPEIWEQFAIKQNNESFAKTTADIPDYDELMEYRLGLLKKWGYKISQLQEVIETMDPLSGALEFINWIKSRIPFIILSDTFYEISAPLMKKLEYPTLFCHNLIINEEQEIVSYKLRTPDPKKKMVQSLQKNGFHVIAIGDSFNDVSMLHQADISFLFKAKEKIISTYPDIPRLDSYEELKKELNFILNGGSL